jgi:replicative DNA helicase
MTEAFHAPPHSTDIERALLGAVLQDNRVLYDIEDVVGKQDFYLESHRLIYAAMADMNAKGIPADVVSIADYLERRNKIDDVGGLAYIGQLQQDYIVSPHAKHYGETIRDYAIERDLLRAANDIAQAVHKPEARNIDELLAAAENQMFRIGESRDRRDAKLIPVSADVPDMVEAIRLRMEDNAPAVGTSTGYGDIDRRTNGLKPGQLVIVGGRPSMGKTSLAMNIATNVAQADGRVICFSLEMSRKELTLRLLADLARLDLLHLAGGKLSDTEFTLVERAAETLSNLNIELDDSAQLTLREIRARAYRTRRKEGKVDLILIDYLQLMQHESGETRNSELSTITRGLKILAKDLETPIVLLSQLNRAVEQRPNKRPVLSDLRDSGAIEQDADLVAFVYRDEVYNDETEDKGIAEIILAKNRNGPIATARLAFLANFTRFENLAHAEEVH